jgi:hypothetical protein
LGLLTMSSRTFWFIIAAYSIIKFKPTSSVNKELLKKTLQQCKVFFFKP